MAEPQGHLPAGTFAPAKAGSSPNNVEFEFSYHDVPTFSVPPRLNRTQEIVRHFLRFVFLCVCSYSLLGIFVYPMNFFEQNLPN
jgi:hypothetical protein